FSQTASPPYLSDKVKHSEHDAHEHDINHCKLADFSKTGRPSDPPPLKWSDLRYVFDIKEDCNGKEALQARRDRREAAAGGCSGLAGPRHDGGDPSDRCERGDLLSLASRV